MLNPFAVFCFVFLSGRALVLLFFVSQCPLRSPQLCLLCLPLGRPYRHCVCLCIIQRPLSSRSLILATTKAAVAPRTAPHEAAVVVAVTSILATCRALGIFYKNNLTRFLQEQQQCNNNAWQNPHSPDFRANAAHIVVIIASFLGSSAASTLPHSLLLLFSHSHLL